MDNATHPDDMPLRLTHPTPEVLVSRGKYLIEEPDGAIEGYTNLDLATDKGRALFINAGCPGEIDFDENGTARILACHFVVYPDTGVNVETGEERAFSRTVLIDRHGKMYRTTSEYAPRRLRAAMALYSEEKWARGIPFIITQRRSRKTGRTYHDLRVEVECS
jgi:hypothetical protein